MNILNSVTGDFKLDNWPTLDRIWNSTLVSYIREHFFLFLIGVGLAILFTHISMFSELVYGAVRYVVILFATFTAANVAFKETIRPFLHSGNLVEAFNGLTPDKRLYVTVLILIGLLWAATKCFCSA